MKQSLLTMLSLALALGVYALPVRTEPPTREYQFSSFDKPSPVVSHIHQLRQSSLEQPRKAKGDTPEEAEPTVAVTFRFGHDTQRYRLECITLVSNEFSNERKVYIYPEELQAGENGEFIAQLPEGIYDVVLEFGEVVFSGSDIETAAYFVRQGIWYYMLEDLSVTSSMPAFDIDIVKDCHAIKPDFHFVNGDTVKPDVVDSSDPQNEVVIEKGNICYSLASVSCYNTKYQQSIATSHNVGTILDHVELGTKGMEYHTVYVNKVSDRWMFLGAWHYVTSDMQEVYSYTATMKPSDTKISVAPSDLTLLPWNFSRSKTYDENAQNRDVLSMLNISYRDVDDLYGAEGIINMNFEKPKVYVFNMPDPKIVTGYILADVEKRVRSRMFGIQSCEMVVVDGQVQYRQTQRGIGGTGLMSGPYEAERDNCAAWPVFTNGHKRFSYIAKDFAPTFGLTAPILRVENQISYDQNDNGAYSNTLYVNYVGQQGDIRDINRANMVTKVTYNGEVVEAAYEGDPIKFCYEWLGKNQPQGVMEYEMLTEDVFEDGIEGYNKTYIYTDQTKDDGIAPTLTMLMCRDTDDRITNRFAAPEKGVVEFSASDFSSEEYWVPEGWNFSWWDAHDIDNVKTEWSPYGEDSWTEFAVEEVPEYFEQGFGSFYRGSLAGVNKPSANNWYDLRFTLTDATGNKQQQTVSPAFRIESLSGLHTVAAIDSAAPVEYYTMQGVRILNPEPGQIVIVRQSARATKQVIN